MLLNPTTLALMLVSWVVLGMMLLAAGFSVQVLRHWDIASGSELQLRMERRTYLISSLVAMCFTAALVSLLLFIYNAEQLSSQFVGAMCATGVLNVNPYGWPTLYLKIVIFFAGAVWLSLNRVDNLAPDYPLVKVKYRLLLLLLPLLLAEAIVQSLYFLQMAPDVITSCCGALFTPQGEGLAAEISGIQPRTALLLLGAGSAAVLMSGGWYLRKHSGALSFAASNLFAFVVALLAIVSCIALYIYEHPNHHCPFCTLKSGHDFIGYFLYVPLFGAAALALAAGAAAPFQGIASLRPVIRTDNRRLVTLSMFSLLLFLAVAAYAMLTSSLSMDGVWW